MTNPASEIIKTQGLTKYYGRFTGISDLDLSVRSGEIYGFLGPNGAGKTTTIRLLLGLIRPSSGRISILGQKAGVPDRKRFNDIGYLPGDLGLYRDLSGRDYLRHFLRLRGKCGGCNRRMERLMDRFPIAFDKKIAAYSKGMRQVVGIIQAFMHDPRLLILDEPTSGLDPIMQELFYDLLMEEKRAGKTIFFSSHILSEVARICDRAGMVKNGRLIRVEEIGGRRAGHVKKIIIAPQQRPQQSAQTLESLPGVNHLALKNGKIEFYYTGDMQRLVEHMAAIGVEDMICEYPALEDMFHKYYEG